MLKTITLNVQHAIIRLEGTFNADQLRNELASQHTLYNEHNGFLGFTMFVKKVQHVLRNELKEGNIKLEEALEFPALFGFNHSELEALKDQQLRKIYLKSL